MQFTTRLLYEQISDRFIKVVWTHKTHECQADIYREHNSRNKICLRILSVLTATGTIAALIDGLNSKWVAIITAVVAAINLFFILTNSESNDEQKAIECRRFAAIMHDMRNQYESLLADIMNGQLTDEEIVKKRNALQERENEIYTTDVPVTTPKAVKRAGVALNVKKESTTEAQERNIILPSHLQLH